LIERRTHPRVEGRHQHDSERSDGKQSGNARDRVVDSRRHARIALRLRSLAVVVSGATTIDIPNPPTSTAGKNVVQYEPPTAGRA
jgi:hypothetical protein